MGEFIAKAVPWIIPLFLLGSFLVNSKVTKKLPRPKGKEKASSENETPVKEKPPEREMTSE